MSDDTVTIFPKTQTIKYNKMSNWKKLKEEYLKQKPEEKMKCCFNLNSIKTWKSTYCGDNVKQFEMKGKDWTKFVALSEKISYFEGDIITLAIDAIVNYADTTLMGGSGDVDDAIHKYAGLSLKSECVTLKGCQIGEAKITGAYKLPSKYIIHTVGPKDEDEEILRKCYQNCLNLLVSNNLRSIAFPSLSTGTKSTYPTLPAAHIALYEVRKFLDKNLDKIDRVIFCLLTREDKKIYKELLPCYFPV